MGRAALIATEHIVVVTGIDERLLIPDRCHRHLSDDDLLTVRILSLDCSAISDRHLGQTSWSGEPSCVSAETADGWLNWVMSGVPPVYRFQFIVISEAPSARPVATI